jgi:hypothetical protein
VRGWEEMEMGGGRGRENERHDERRERGAERGRKSSGGDAQRERDAHKREAASRVKYISKLGAERATGGSRFFLFLLLLDLLSVRRNWLI